MEESTALAGGLGGSERLVLTADGPAVVPGATVKATGSSIAEARVSRATPESRMEKPTVPGEQTVLPEVSEGMVGHAVRPPSPQVLPPAVEEDEVEEIEREESRSQAI